MKWSSENAEILAEIVVENMDLDSLVQYVLDDLTDRFETQKESFRINCEVHGIQFEE